MERHFDEELKALKESLLGMAALVEKMIEFAMKTLEGNKPELAEKVFEFESEVNSKHLEVDGMCIKMLALRQPIASDLRFITSAMKINSELERIGDQAVNVSQNAQVFLSLQKVTQLFYIPKMAEITKQMVSQSIKAFVSQDVNLAESVLVKDDLVDNLKKRTVQEFIPLMEEDPSSIHKLFDLILIARNLERIADHTTNIAEDIIFMVTGEDIRHHKKDKGKVEKK